MSRLIGIILISGCLQVMIGAPREIGTVRSLGEFRVDGAAIRGNGTLFDGDVIETAFMRSSSDSGALTAWSNDYSFASAFERQVEALGQPGNVPWGISTGSNSANVLRALAAARFKGLCTLGLTDADGWRMASLCDVLIMVPLNETPRIQEIHLITYHAICGEVEGCVFGDANAGKQ